MSGDPDDLLSLLRCPFCGGRLNLNPSKAPESTAFPGADYGVLWCECCAFPLVAGIPVLKSDDSTRAALQALEAGDHDAALFAMLGLDGTRAHAFRALHQPDGSLTYRRAMELLSPDPEGTYFVYRFSDPTFVMAEAILEALSAETTAFEGRILDLCGGSGHLTRVLTTLHPHRAVVLADMFFWKLWLARTFTAPRASAVCSDANHPLPFAPGTFQTVVLSDAFPYIWHKRLLAEEMMRQTGPTGTIVMPHLHSSLGWNYSAGMTLTPASYSGLFTPMRPRLFPDRVLFEQAVSGETMDFSQALTPEALGDENSFTLIASGTAGAFRRLPRPLERPVTGELIVNPLYRVDWAGGSSRLSLTFPNPNYEAEFGDVRRYLPDTLDVAANLTGRIEPGLAGVDLAALRRRRVVLDVPPRYV